jgi:nicotinamidase-related amidase
MSVQVPLQLDKAVLLVHDVVNHFLDPAGPEPDPGLPAVVEKVGTLVSAARAAGLPVVFVGPGQGDPAIGHRPTPNAGAATLQWGTPGCDVPATLGPLPGDTMIRKPRWGGFYGSDLAAHLRREGRDTIVVCGLSLAGGVETTVRDAHNHDLHSIVVEDACLCRAVPDQGWGAASRDEVRKVVLTVLAQRFARITTTAELCAELRRARSE